MFSAFLTKETEEKMKRLMDPSLIQSQGHTQEPYTSGRPQSGPRTTGGKTMLLAAVGIVVVAIVVFIIVKNR